MTSALLFDFDGLIVDTETMWAEVVIEILSADGIDLEMDDVRDLVGVAGREFEEAWARFAATHLTDGFDRETLRSNALAATRQRFVGLEMLPGVRDLIDGASARGWRTGLGTGSRLETVRPRLEHHGLGEAFDAIVTIDDVDRGKPSPDIYLELARRLDVDPTACVVLEDSVHGCQAALAAGMRVIACPCTITRGSAFPPEAVIVETLRDVELERLAELLKV